MDYWVYSFSISCVAISFLFLGATMARWFPSVRFMAILASALWITVFIAMQIIFEKVKP